MKVIIIVPDEGYWSYLMKVIPETRRVYQDKTKLYTVYRSNDLFVLPWACCPQNYDI
jgi:hypothetical protein